MAPRGIHDPSPAFRREQQPPPEQAKALAVVAFLGVAGGVAFSNARAGDYFTAGCMSICVGLMAYWAAIVIAYPIWAAVLSVLQAIGYRRLLRFGLLGACFVGAVSFVARCSQ